MEKIGTIIERDPYLNFVALLKNYKVLGRFLHGTLKDFYRDRNKRYFKKFFYDDNLYEAVKKDIEMLYPKYGCIKMTLTKRGVITYDNYKKNSFNILLMTIHSGTWIPEHIEKKISIKKKKRYKEEDIDSNWLYNRLVLEKGGIWIDNKQSRFVIDFNRQRESAIYADNSEDWLDVVWMQELTEREKSDIHDSYRAFYFTIARLVESYNFNIIFDGHSMRHKEGRPSISFGTEYIPAFYMPIVRSMQHKMVSMGYGPVKLNAPYSGGYILKWLSQKFPHVFIFSMEVNKKLYMSSDVRKARKRKVNQISKDIVKILDIEIEDETS